MFTMNESWVQTATPKKLIKTVILNKKMCVYSHGNKESCEKKDFGL